MMTMTWCRGRFWTLYSCTICDLCLSQFFVMLGLGRYVRLEAMSWVAPVLAEVEHKAVEAGWLMKGQAWVGSHVEVEEEYRTRGRWRGQVYK